MTSQPPYPQQGPPTGHQPPGHGYPQPGHGYPQPGPAYAPPAIPPAAFTRRYRVTAWVLIWVPVGLVGAVLLASVVLLMLADADPVNNSAYGYLAVTLWALVLVIGLPLLGAFVPGLVMLTRSGRARSVMRATGFAPPS